MPQKTNQMSIPFDAITAGTALNSLGSQTAASFDATHQLTALEVDTVLTRIAVHLSMDTTGLSHTNAAAARAWCLVLANGIIDATEVAAIMDGGFADQTPSAGGQTLVEAQDSQKKIITVLYPELVGMVIDPSDEAIAIQQDIHYEGPPLTHRAAKGDGSWYFGKDMGWKWFVYNYGAITFPGVSSQNALIRYWNKYSGVN